MEIWRVFRFARFVRKKTKINKDYALESFLIARFIEEKHKWWGKRFTAGDLSAIIDYARKEDYLGAYVGSPGPKLKVSVPKGHKLLDFPFGTLQTFLSEYGLAISFLTGSFFTIVTLTATGLGIKLLRYILGLI